MDIEKEKSVPAGSNRTKNRIMVALWFCLGASLAGSACYVYGVMSTKNEGSASKDNGYQISWHFARLQVQDGLQEEIKKFHGPVRIKGSVVTCPDSQSEFIWSLRPPSGNDLMQDAKKRTVMIAYAAGIGCKGQRRIATVRELPANHHWENGTAVVDDEEISWLFHCLVKDLDQTELARDKEFRKLGI